MLTPEQLIATPCPQCGAKAGEPCVMGPRAKKLAHWQRRQKVAR